jgi:hypothetical protein
MRGAGFVAIAGERAASAPSLVSVVLQVSNQPSLREQPAGTSTAEYADVRGCSRVFAVIVTQLVTHRHFQLQIGAAVAVVLAAVSDALRCPVAPLFDVQGLGLAGLRWCLENANNQLE